MRHCSCCLRHFAVGSRALVELHRESVEASTLAATVLSPLHDAHVRSKRKPIMPGGTVWVRN